MLSFIDQEIVKDFGPSYHVALSGKRQFKSPYCSESATRGWGSLGWRTIYSRRLCLPSERRLATLLSLALPVAPAG
jgi:hypothetical protein